MTMQPEELAAALKSLGLKKKDLARLLSEPDGRPVAAATITRWTSPASSPHAVTVPGPVAAVVRILLHLQAVGFDPARIIRAVRPASDAPPPSPGEPRDCE